MRALAAVIEAIQKQMKKPSISLVHVLIAKSIIETLLISALDVQASKGIHLVVPRDRIRCESGIVLRTERHDQVVGPGRRGPGEAHPVEQVEVQLFVDDKFVARTVASQSRPQVVAGGWARDEWHGFTIPVSAMEVGYHEGRVYALHNSGAGSRKTLQQLGHVLHFQVVSDGTLKSLDPPSEPSPAVNRKGED